MTPEEMIEDYLSRVAVHLPRRGRATQDVLAELRDGLHEALEAHPLHPAEPAYRFLAREFGEPAVIGAALASEMRLRLARRHALGVLLVLLATGAAWSLYEALVGVSPAAAPAGVTEMAFFAALEVLMASVTVAQVAAGLAVVAVSLPVRRLAHSPLPALLGRAAMVSLAAFLGSAAVMALLMAPGHRIEGALGGAAVAAVALPCLVAARMMARHAEHARRAQWLVG
jgi:hypothetical protein